MFLRNTPKIKLLIQEKAMEKVQVVNPNNTCQTSNGLTNLQAYSFIYLFIYYFKFFLVGYEEKENRTITQ